MPYKINLLEDKGIVFIENRGDLTYEELVEQSKDAISIIHEKNIYLILTDFSNVGVDAKITDIYQFPEIYEQFGLTKMSKIAVLVSAKEVSTEQLTFYENICINRGWQIKIFLKKELALEWLENNG